ncbi:MAG: hypothetical protein AAF502_13770 [Bacteroidota bacterium]
MKRIFSLVILLVVGLIVYNQFYGTEEDKERGKVVVKESKEAFKSILDLLKAEKANYDEGKYEDAMEKIGGLFKTIGEKVETIGEDYPERFKELEEKKSAIEEKLEQIESSESSESRSSSVSEKEVESELKDLLKDLEKLTDDMNNQ